MSPTIKFTEDMIIKSKKDFLSNKENKERFIKLLRERLEAAGCLTEQATGEPTCSLSSDRWREQDPAQLYW